MVDIKIPGISSLNLSLAIDLGTANTLVGVPTKGIIYRQPTVVARRIKKLGKHGEILAYGRKAKFMVGREPQQMKVINLLQDGAIADLDATVAYLRYMLGVVNELPSRWPRVLKPSAVIGVPSGITTVEKRAVYSAAADAGIGKISLVEEPLASALGAGLMVDKPAGNMVIDVGGGTTEMAIISLGGIVLHRSLTVAGQEMDEAIINFVRVKYGVLLGTPTAQKIKHTLGSAMPNGAKKDKISVRGRGLENGLPRTIELSQEEVRESLSPIIQQIKVAVDELLEETPPELTSDISQRGIVLTGGASQLSGLDKLISDVTEMPVWRANDPSSSVVMGALKLLEDKKLLQQVRIVGGVK
jgi:rod shape-determining protein MreB